MRGAIRTVLMVALFTGAASAQSPEDIDFQLLLDQNADRVQVPSPDMLLLELPGPVIVTCQGGRCTAEDQSAHGAAGCSLRVVTLAAVHARLCPDLLTQADHAALTDRLTQGWAFYAANLVPAWSAERRDARMAQAQADLATQMGNTCRIGTDAELRYLRALARPGLASRLRRAFQRPRLPVFSPCN